MQEHMCFLAASLLLASQASAISFQPGDNALVLFNTAGSGSFVMDSGVSADAIANGAGFALDISPAFAALGGTIESFGLIGRTAGSGGPIFNYSELLYVSQDEGLIYAQSKPADLRSNVAMSVITNNLSGYFESLQAGPTRAGQQTVQEGYLADLEANVVIVSALGTGLLNPTPFSNNANTDLYGIQLFHQFHNDNPTSTSTEQTVPFRLQGSPLSIEACREDSSPYDDVEKCIHYEGFYTTFGIRDSQLILAGTLHTPIPGATWLFISAIAGLLSFRTIRE